jgi:hypothetical protein
MKPFLEKLNPYLHHQHNVNHSVVVNDSSDEENEIQILKKKFSPLNKKKAFE